MALGSNTSSFSAISLTIVIAVWYVYCLLVDLHPITKKNSVHTYYGMSWVWAAESERYHSSSCNADETPVFLVTFSTVMCVLEYRNGNIIPGFCNGWMMLCWRCTFCANDSHHVRPI